MAECLKKGEEFAGRLVNYHKSGGDQHNARHFTWHIVNRSSSTVQQS